MLNIIGKGKEEERPERCAQEAEERVEEGLGKESEKLEAERSDINDKNALESSWTNV